MGGLKMKKMKLVWCVDWTKTMMKTKMTTNQRNHDLKPWSSLWWCPLGLVDDGVDVDWIWVVLTTNTKHHKKKIELKNGIVKRNSGINFKHSGILFFEKRASLWFSTTRTDSIGILNYEKKQYHVTLMSRDPPLSRKMLGPFNFHRVASFIYTSFLYQCTGFLFVRKP